MRSEPLEVRHAALVLGDLQDPALYAYIPEPRPDSLAQLEARYGELERAGTAEERWHNWIAFDRETPVGNIQITQYPAERRAIVSWVIFPRCWRRGYGTAAARWMLAWLAREGVVLAEATIDPRNAASLALAAKLGFQRVGSRDGDVLMATKIP
jgi:RimJ/RimL family protein N-acetyltransferase